MRFRNSALYLLLSFIVISNTLTSFGQTKDKGEREPVIFAVINGNRVITGKEVDESLGSQIQELQEKIYFIRNTALNNLITKALLEEEAKSRSVTVDELKRHLMPGKVEVTQSKVDEIYDENANLFANMSQDEAKARIRLDLESHEKMSMFKAALD